MTRLLQLLGGVTALAVAAALVATAVDVHRWSETLRAEDVRFEQAPALPRWEASETLPVGVARVLLGIDDDVEFRRAVRDFGRLARAFDTGVGQQAASVIEASRRLASVSQNDPNERRRSLALNLMGVLTLYDPSYSSPTLDAGRARLEAAIRNFQAAIAADPESEEAKRNLEVILRQQIREFPLGSSPDSRRSDAGSRAGRGRSGQGY
jgi:hypothetical protein